MITFAVVLGVVLFVYAALFLVPLGIAGYGAYWFFTRERPAPPPTIVGEEPFDPREFATDMLNLCYKEWGDRFPPRSVTLALIGLFHDTIEHEPVANKPTAPTNPNILEKAKYHDAIDAYNQAFTPETMRVYQKTYERCVSHIYRAVPKTSFKEFKEAKDAPYAIPLIDHIQNPKRVMQECILAFYNKEARDLHLFDHVRASFDANMARFKKETFPEDFEGTPREAVEAYLRNTPLYEVFHASIPFSINYQDRHAVIYAAQRYGKTELIQSLLMDHLHDPNSPALMVIDSQSSQGKGLLPNIERLKFWETHPDRLVVVDASASTPPALNIFNTGPDDARSVMEGFEYILKAVAHEWTPQQEASVSFVISVLTAHRERTGEIPTLRTLRDFLNEDYGQQKFKLTDSKYAQTIQSMDDDTQQYFRTQFYEPTFRTSRQLTASRLHSILRVPAFAAMFAATDNKLDLLDCIRKRKVVLVYTSQTALGLQASNIFGRFMLGEIYKTGLKRPEGEAPNCVVYVDEASDYMDDSVQQLLIQSGKRNIWLRFATQQPALIPENIRRIFQTNCDLRIAGGVRPDDASSLARDLRATPEFLLSLKKNPQNTATQWAVYLAYATEQAVKLTVPFFRMRDAPKLDEQTYKTRAATLRRKMAASAPSPTQAHTRPQDPTDEVKPKEPPDRW